MSRDISDRITMFIQHHLIQDFAKKHNRSSKETDDAYASRLHREFINTKSTARHSFTMNRIALNMDQITQYAPPPNPAKMTDVRAAKYVEEFGDESWELDALEPAVIAGLIEEAVLALCDQESWDMMIDSEENHKATLKYAADNWEAVEELKRANEED